MKTLEKQTIADLKIIAQIRIKKENLILGFLSTRQKYITANFIESCSQITNQQEHANHFAACTHLLAEAATILGLPANNTTHTPDSREGERSPATAQTKMTARKRHNRYLTPGCFFTHNKTPTWLEAEKSFTLDDGSPIIAGKQYRLLATDSSSDDDKQPPQAYLEDPTGIILKLPLNMIYSNFLQGHTPNTTFQK